LTIQMIRSLHSGLDIPLEVLLQDSAKPQLDHVATIDWSRFPVDEMIKLGWLKSTYRKSSDHASELMKAFLEPLEGRLSQVAMCRRTPANIDPHLLLAWIARVQIRAQEERRIDNYAPDKINKDFLREVAKLSWFDKGPLLAQEFLAKHGIALIIERQLKGAKLDGAAMTGKRGPIIGLTLRYDRIDSFWFTLIHELVHVVKHLKNENTIYVDDLDRAFEDPIEKETDSIASDILVPKNKWKTSRANLQKTSSAVNDLAKELSIHPAIIAGKIRFEANNYTILQELVGHKQVRKLFSDVDW
jgi:HTH-type transcriptional regulator/antitoxin HigA